MTLVLLGSAAAFVLPNTVTGFVLFLVAFVVSAFLADLFTGVSHFCFDYVFPEETPLFGPIAREFRNHHDRPTLDPKNYVVNLTKGAYCSAPLSALAIWAAVSSSGSFGDFLAAVLLGMSFWGFFFHQIHSYSHMGACLSADDYLLDIQRISAMREAEEQKAEFKKLFDEAPIPAPIRFLQRSRIILNPETHNLHHIRFESDFSSVNGWSDPVLNWFLGPIARRMKQRRAIEADARS